MENLRREEFTQLGQLPDPLFHRDVAVPDGYRFMEGWASLGEQADGTSLVTEAGLTFEHDTRMELQVTIWRPWQWRTGNPYVLTVPDQEAPMAMEPVEVAGHPAVFESTEPEHEGGGLARLWVEDGEVLIAVESFAGHAYEELVAIAESLLAEGAIRP